MNINKIYKIIKILYLIIFEHYSIIFRMIKCKVKIYLFLL